MRQPTFVPIAATLLLLAGCGQKSEAPVAKGESIAPVAAPAGTAWTDKVEATPEGGVRMGNPDAPIKLVEYGSLSCPHCAKLAQEGFPKLTGDYVASGRVSLEFRSFMIHPQDVPLTLLAQCGTVDTFFPLVEQIYTNFDAMEAPLQDEAVLKRANAAMQGPPNQRMVGLSDALQYTEFFAARGIPTDKAHACLADEAKAKQIADNARKWATEGINQTPTLLLNGKTLDAAEWDKVEDALKQAGAH